MLMTFLLGCLGGIVGASLMRLLGFWRSHRRETPIYVWPVPGMPPEAALAECHGLAEEIEQRRRADITRFVTQWDSGLGREFPTVGRN